MKTLIRACVILAGAAVLGGCSSGYPSTEDRIEDVDETIRKNNLDTQGNPARDKRFETEVKPGGVH